MKRIAYRNKLFSALEDEVVEVSTDNAEFKDSLLDLNESSAELEKDIANVEEVSAIGKTLSDYEEAITDVVENQEGELSQESLRILSIGLKYVNKRLGVENRSVSLESYHSSREATNVALEDIKETLSNIKQTVSNFVQRFGAWFTRLVGKHTVSKKKLFNRLNKIRALEHRVVKYDNNVKVKGCYNIIRSLAISGKVDTTVAINFNNQFLNYIHGNNNLCDLIRSISDVNQIIPTLKAGNVNGAVTIYKRYINSLKTLIGQIRGNFFGNKTILPGERILKYDLNDITNELKIIYEEELENLEILDSGDNPELSKNDWIFMAFTKQHILKNIFKNKIKVLDNLKKLFEFEDMDIVNEEYSLPALDKKQISIVTSNAVRIINDGDRILEKIKKAYGEAYKELSAEQGKAILLSMSPILNLVYYGVNNYLHTYLASINQELSSYFSLYFIYKDNCLYSLDKALDYCEKSLVAQSKL